MHYYQFNIGSYRKWTSHLTLLEHGIYRALLDTYYMIEGPLNPDKSQLMRSHSVRTQEEIEGFDAIISEFFSLTEDGYRHEDCDILIAKYQEKSNKARLSAQKRWGKDANAVQSQSEGNANHKPLNNKQEPEKSSKRKKGSRLPEDWQPLPEHIEFCKTERPDLDPIGVANRFRDYWIAKTGQAATKMDWTATWRNWVRNERRESGQNGSGKNLSAPERVREAIRQRDAGQTIEGDFERDPP